VTKTPPSAGTDTAAVTPRVFTQLRSHADVDGSQLLLTSNGVMSPPVNVACMDTVFPEVALKPTSPAAHTNVRNLVRESSRFTLEANCD